MGCGSSWFTFETWVRVPDLGGSGGSGWSLTKPHFDDDSKGDDKENCGKRGNGGAVICDMLAVAIDLNYSSLVSSVEKCHIDVELRGTHTRGTTICDYVHCYDHVDRARRILWVSACDSTGLIPMFGLLFVCRKYVVCSWPRDDCGD